MRNYWILLWSFCSRKPMWTIPQPFWRCSTILSCSFLQLTRKTVWFHRHLTTLTFSRDSRWCLKAPTVTVWVKHCCYCTIITAFFHKSSGTQFQCTWWENYSSDCFCTGHLMYAQFFTTFCTFGSIRWRNFRIKTLNFFPDMRKRNWGKGMISWWGSWRMPVNWKRKRWRSKK